MRNLSACLYTICQALRLAVILAVAAPGYSSALPAELTASDWGSIRSEYERHRHRAVLSAEGAVMANPGQQWRTQFDGNGFTVRPDHGAWTWGLALQRYGFPGNETTLTLPAAVTADGPRAACDRDGIVQEWLLNDARGLEHGFTIRQRPPCGVRGGWEDMWCASPAEELSRTTPASVFQEEPEPSRLVLTLAVHGGLHAKVQREGTDVQFTNDAGATVLTYAGLKVWDAEGTVLPARFAPVTAGETVLRLTIDERGAQYPLTIDPIVQQAYLKASNSGESDQFGYAVAASGDTVAVAALGDDVGGGTSGAVYIFVRTGGAWAQQGPALKASNRGAGDLFGSSLGLSGDTLVAGAPYEDSNATGVNGNQADNSQTDPGAAYVFTRTGINWTQQAYLKASNPSHYFGQSVAVSGNTIVVGAHYENGGSSGVNGDQNNQSAAISGAAYVFVRNGNSWSQEAYLKASNTTIGSLFGWSAAIDGDTLVIGAFGEFSNATGVNGNQADHSMENAGAAYVFARAAGVWHQEAYLKASNTATDDKFGFSLGISGNTIVVGAVDEDSSATGVNGNQSDNNASRAGAAYVFTRSGTQWSQQAYLKASNAGGQDNFGHSVAVSGDLIAVGAIGEGSDATGVNGSNGNNNAPNSGAAYVFTRSGTQWSQQAYLKASNTGGNDGLGRSVAVSGTTLVTGAIGEASNAMGVNGAQNDNSTPYGGAAYVYARNTSWAQEAYLKSTNTTATNDQFGWSVGASGDIVVVGAPQESSNATSVDGNQGDVSAPNAGAAYVFVRSNGVWRQEAYLKASNSEAEDHFGWSVAAASDYVVIGAPEEDSAIGGVNNTNAQVNNGTPNSGAVYVFVRGAGLWSQQAYIKASTPGPANLDRFGWSVSASGETIVAGAVDQDQGGTAGAGAAYVFVRDVNGWRQQGFLKAINPDGDDRFGTSVAVSGNTVVVGAEREDGGTTGVNGNEFDITGQNSGAAYVFVRSGEAWSREAYLKASNTGANDAFGWSVAVAGDTVVVGAYLEDSDATGVNHPTGQNNNNASGSGAAYVFERTGGSWLQKAYLKASNTGISDAFGSAVATSGDTVVVGTGVEGSDSTGVNGAQNNNAGGSGAAYIFTRSGGVWSQSAFLKASNTASGDNFGGALAISGGTLVAGAYREDSNARGVNGNQADNSALESGAAYVFNLQAQAALASWRAANFGSPDNSGDGADNADPDHDGLVNLLEFATGQSPLARLPLPATLTKDAEQLSFTYPRLKAANAEMQFGVEWSDSLSGGTWSPAGSAGTVLMDNGVVEQVKVTLPAGTSRRFVRLKVVAY